MCGILLLRRIQLDNNRLFFRIDVEAVAKGLIIFRIHLDPNLTLRQARNFSHALLIGTQLPMRYDLLLPSFTTDRPSTKFTITAARSTGLSASERTSIFSSVIGSSAAE